MEQESQAARDTHQRIACLQQTLDTSAIRARFSTRIVCARWTNKIFERQRYCVYTVHNGPLLPLSPCKYDDPWTGSLALLDRSIQVHKDG